jgi:hypothetical protein
LKVLFDSAQGAAQDPPVASAPGLHDGGVQSNGQGSRKGFGQGQHRRHADRSHQFQGSRDLGFVFVVCPTFAVAFFFGGRGRNGPRVERGQLTGWLHDMDGQAGGPADALGPVIEQSHAGAARTAAPAQAIIGFEDDGMAAAQDQLPRAGQTGDATADDRDARWRGGIQPAVPTAALMIPHGSYLFRRARLVQW